MFELDKLTNDVLAEMYHSDGNEIATLEAEKKAIANEVKRRMGTAGHMELSNGWHFTKYPIERKNYPTGVVMALLGDEAVNFLKVDKLKLDNYVAGQLERSQGAARTKWAKTLAHLLSKQVVESTSEGLKLAITKEVVR